MNRPFVSQIEGLDRDASLELLDRLCRQADAPEHQCRFTWTKDAVAFWDNRAVQHYAVERLLAAAPHHGAGLRHRHPALPPPGLNTAARAAWRWRGAAGRLGCSHHPRNGGVPAC